ncbi:DNA polymerase III subunit alpha [bacterium BMS3Abin04]|nr:DNA polymerase III subunit alpha [bacterium BMS3Abin04]
MFTLHAHSTYSLLQGVISIDDLITSAKKSDSRYVALTDTNGMYGLIQFAKRAEEQNIKPILGAWIDSPNNKNINAIFLAKNNEGYSELCKIITSRKLKDDFSLINLIHELPDNLFILTSSLEFLEQLTLNSKLRKNLYVELIVTEKQKGHTRKLYHFARKNNLQIVATHPAYFLASKDFLLHKTVTAIRLNTTIENLQESDLVDPEFGLKTPQELNAVWKALPEAIWNADYIAKHCNINLKFGKYKFPGFPLPKGESAFSYLWKIAFRGLEDRYKPITDKAVKRLQYELEVIDDLGYSDYFLIVWDIVREAHKRNMLTVGRGSAADSLVAYCLGLTQIDPVKHNLYFERFLNRGRTSPPDVDIDFSWKERDEIVKYVFEKYGYDHVAMISTTITFRARSAFRETAKVFGISEQEIAKFNKLIPWTSAKNLPYLTQKFPETKSLKLDIEPWETIVCIASKLAGFPRHNSIHPSGIVITKKPIINYIALEYAKNKGLGLIVTQPDMYSVENMGLVKIDLLSQRSLGVLRDTLESISSLSRIKTKNPKIFLLKETKEL